MTESPVLYGAAYSVYVRAARLALEEKAVPYDLVEVDVFASGGPPAWYVQHQPFGRIPALEHAGFRLYESGAIERYVDEAFSGPPLQPPDPRARARMNQVMSMIDSYAYGTLVRTIFVERVRAPARGNAPEEARIAEALPRAATFVQALARICSDGPWLAGDRISLADLHAAPMFAYFRMTPEGAGLMGEYGAIAKWWERMAARPSMAATRSPLE